MPDYLTIEEAAELLRLTRSALYEQRRRGALPGALGVRVGARILFSRKKIDEYVDDQIAENLAIEPLYNPDPRVQATRARLVSKVAKKRRDDKRRSQQQR